MTTAALAAAPVAALLAELIDDAGLFPPASLEMGDAVSAHLAARHGEFRWMLGRFVCPSDQIALLAQTLPHELDRPVRLTVIASLDADTPPRDPRWTVEALEARLPDTDVGGAASMLAAVARAAGAWRAWLEIPWREFPIEEWPAAATAVGAYSASGRTELGLKIRCGGETPDTVPSPAVLAAVLVACRDAGVPLKATAGLHHPFRHTDELTNAMQHGFVNLAIGAVLARARRLTAVDLAEVLAEEDGEAFVLSSDGVGWRGLLVDVDAVTDTRRRLFAGVGSCSFLEPVDDLVALGILRRTE